MVCAKEICHLVDQKLQNSGKIHKKMKCALDIIVDLEYRVDKPDQIHFYCYKPASNFYNLLPLINEIFRQNLELVNSLLVTNCELPEHYSMLEVKFPNVFRLILMNIRLTKKFFDMESKIEEIEVDYVNDMEMENFPFFKMPKLRKIDFRLSGLHPLVLKKDALIDNRHLTDVRIRSSNIKMLPDNLFRYSTNVQHIDFYNNEIKHVPNTLFTNLTSLQTIKFRSNMIESIDL